MVLELNMVSSLYHSSDICICRLYVPYGIFAGDCGLLHLLRSSKEQESFFVEWESQSRGIWEYGMKSDETLIFCDHVDIYISVRSWWREIVI